MLGDGESCVLRSVKPAGGSQRETVKDGARIEARARERREGQVGDQEKRLWDQSAIWYSSATVTVQAVLFVAAKARFEDEGDLVRRRCFGRF